MALGVGGIVVVFLINFGQSVFDLLGIKAFGTQGVMDGADGFAAPTQGDDHSACIDGIIKQAGFNKFFNQSIDHSGAIVVALVLMCHAGALDLAHHHSSEIGGAGGVAFKIIQSGIVEIGWGDLLGLFTPAGLAGRGWLIPVLSLVI